jgi:acetate CoA/acetoacetate CoA-transferase beta subunit
MDEKTLIAKRVAQELRPGYLVNLGIGLTACCLLVPRDADIFQSENGIVGAAILEEGLEAEDLTDAGGSPMAHCQARRHSTAPCLSA